MTEEQFEHRHSQIAAGAQHQQVNIDAFRDQELARLLVDCHWSPERIARWMGRAEAWVHSALAFGRFVVSVSVGDKAHPVLENLTEATFRRLYRSARGNEEERFAEVLRKLSGDVPSGYKNLLLKPGFRKAVATIMADGQWRTTGQILGLLQLTFPDADLSVVQHAVRGLLCNPPRGRELISQKSGRICQYRMRDAVLAERQAPASLVTSLVEGVKPIIRELKQWGRHSEYEMSPSAIRMLAIQLERLFEPLIRFPESGSWDSHVCHEPKERKAP